MTAPHHRLEQRKVRFDFSATPLHWVPDEPEVSHVMNTLHILLPAGEFWFCRVYNKAVPLITDPLLLDDVRGFIKQEAQHARAHDSALEPYLYRHGIDPSKFLRGVRWLFDKVLCDHPLGDNALSRRLQRWWLVQRVGLIAAVEHFTCVLGDWVITTDKLDHANPVMLDLMRWHGAEEVEHRCVAHDLHVHLGGSIVMRWFYMVVATLALTYLFHAGSRLMMRQDPAIKRVRGFLPLWRELGRRGVLPRMGAIGRAVGRYFLPGYHPRTESDTSLALAYLASSPAAQRAAEEARTGI
ncbi:metal-dependent hydrolase [Zestomonas carbonaria]|uniref:Metal-dependent hydrolase n=1 Tax=Zestomonas carbonaria TaxID=2762745 RepID=A0A7U7I9R4_9GAMM|nr:metal-dependent hydrolase [Pseudomonas carbonaria]CAD5108684.1 hypothetical protein PSEWESI4_02976 [Pseudomonas carbonaria]